MKSRPYLGSELIFVSGFMTLFNISWKRSVLTTLMTVADLIASFLRYVLFHWNFHIDWFGKNRVYTCSALRQIQITIAVLRSCIENRIINSGWSQRFSCCIRFRILFSVFFLILYESYDIFWTFIRRCSLIRFSQSS